MYGCIPNAVQRAMVALALITAAAAVQAGPIYHVTLDTGRFSGQGWLDLQFNPGFDGAAESAVLSHFSGTLDAALAERDGDVQGVLPGALTFSSNGALNALFQPVRLGGVFSFDLELVGESSVFALGLYGADRATALGKPDPFTGSLLSIDPLRGVTLSDPSLVSLAAPVPEPGGAWLMAAGLGALALAFRRRPARGGGGARVAPPLSAAVVGV